MSHFPAILGGGEPVASWSDVLGDGTIRGEETLGVPGGVEALHPPLPLAGGLMRMLGAVAQIPVLAMFHTGQEIRHELSGQTQRAAVTMDAGRLQFHRPVEQRVTVFEGNGFTSTGANNVDVWEKVD